MKNSFRRIETQLKNLSGNPQGHAATRITMLSGLINGMIRKGSSHLVDLGSGIPKNVEANSKTTAAKRFISNKWTDNATHFLPFLKAFLHGVLTFTNLNQGIVLVIDGSQTGKNNATLMVSLVWRNRAIPICWSVKEGGKGHFKTVDHLQVLEQAIDILKDIIPIDIPVTILGDGEFDSIDIQKLCLGNNWDYVLRTACNTVFYEDGELFHARNVSPAKEHNTMLIEHVEFTEKRYKYVNFVCWHDAKRHKEPIYLISNLSCAGQIIEYYDMRYAIECLFKDMKSTAFNLHKTRLTKPDQVNNLVMIAALAFIFLTILAIQYDTIEWRKKVQRYRKDQKVLSFFTFAIRLFKHFIDYDIPFDFSFDFSKNLTKTFSLNC
jgi:hypothetical protein